MSAIVSHGLERTQRIHLCLNILSTLFINICKMYSLKSRFSWRSRWVSVLGISQINLWGSPPVTAPQANFCSEAEGKYLRCLQHSQKQWGGGGGGGGVPHAYIHVEQYFYSINFVFFINVIIDKLPEYLYTMNFERLRKSSGLAQNLTSSPETEPSPLHLTWFWSLYPLVYHKDLNSWRYNFRILKLRMLICTHVSM